MNLEVEGKVNCLPQAAGIDGRKKWESGKRVAI